MIGEGRRLIIKIAVIVVVAALIVAFFVFHHQQEEKKRVQMQLRAWECEQAIAPLQKQQDEILEKIADLNKRLRGEDLSLASVLLLFVQPNEDIILEALPTLQDFEFPALVCCEPGSFPGDPHCISVEQARELIALGWEFGLSLVPEDDVAALCREMTDRGLPSPTIAYYPLSNFKADDPASEQTLLAEGITTVLQYNFVPEETDEHQLRYIAAYGFREQNCRSVLASTVANSNVLAFSVGYSNAYERFELRPFVSMNELFHNGVEKERMVVTTPDEALSRRAEWTRVRDERQGPLTAEREEYLKQLAEVENEITRVYNQYISEEP